ncbi:hypothetical protein [Clostridium tarantellae]|uniref:Uncharacterized protein n=1 Tax=Clostridium tarantellae TaxID=39493 RepID=A0A6I1MI71_9CLOT|nr:hypothetical protein [Clostridium tarantellae]MPQ43065.1 hypothetical protein [Clostridium tarantellae]
MRRKLIIAALSIFLTCSSATAVKAYNGDITIPTQKVAVVDGKIKSQIQVAKEKTIVDPWMYVDVKLDATKSKQNKNNYAELALKRAFAYFIDNKLSIGDGDFSIILNNGFVINKNNYKSKKITNIAKKEILDKDFYRGDTIFKLAYLYHDNAIERTTYWKLIDTIDLPAGSSHTLNKKYSVGINKNEQLNIGQALGIKLITGAEVSGGADCKFASAKILAKLNGELNRTVSKTFENSRKINSVFESNTNISYNVSNEDKVVLRYQLVDNFKVDSETFKNATSKLESLMNTSGVKIVKIIPTAGTEGVDVPMDQVFDITIKK